jgi:PIN domain nuclease of toxin-antitoxin system
MNLTMDAAALIAFLKKETGADAVEALLLDEDNLCSVHALNMCEVYYDLHREYGEPAVEAAIDALLSIGIQIREDMDRGLCREAGRLKANLRRMSLADCFCAALANKTNAEVVTADHHEFDALAANGACRVRFIR